MPDWPTLVQLITAIAWPLTVIIIAFMFRHEIRKTVDRLDSVSYKDYKANFKQNLGKVAREIEELPIKEVGAESSTEKQGTDTTNSLAYLKRLADISPKAAIIEAWRDIEILTKKVVVAYGIDSSATGLRAIRELVQNELLPESIIPVYQGMRELRNQAVHAIDRAITHNEADQYIDTALTFENALLFLLDQASKSDLMDNDD